MATLSRQEKYKELREQLQNDNTTEISSSDLHSYEDRLNRIDANNFSAPAENYHSANEDTAAHLVRRRRPTEQVKPEEAYFQYPNLQQNENNTAQFDDEYLNKYVDEVKRYNVEQGNAYSENTTLNVLRSLQQNPQPQSRPYPKTREDTADIPFRKNYNTGTQNISRPADPDQQQMTREDIMNEVRSLVNNPASSAVENTGTTQIPETKGSIDDSTRQQLLNETTQMRAQLDDYGDNLNEMSDKVRHTSRVMNVVLIVVIAALAVVCFIVIYWIMLVNK